MEIIAKEDIDSTEKIQQMVDAFYERVNADPLLSPVFNGVAAVDWEHHLPNMYLFWNALILGMPGYKGQPFPMHMYLALTTEHFDRWLQLFRDSIDEKFSGRHTDLAKFKAESIAAMFQYKLGLKEGA